jgi:hypothetical protein
MFQALLLRHRRWFVSLAILAVLMNALAPGLSQAMQPSATGSAASWLEVCSAAGSKWIKQDAAGQVLEQTSKRPAGAPDSAHGAACGYCLPHAGSFALLDTAPPSARPAALGASTCEAAPAVPAPVGAPAWTRPALRAPPQA